MRHLAIVAALLFAATGVSAQTLVFDLPGVLGLYDESASARADTLTYGGAETYTVVGMTVTYDGSAMIGLTQCPDGYGGYDTLVWGLELYSYVHLIGVSDWNETWAGGAIISDDGALSSFVTTFGHQGFVKLSPGDRIVVDQYFLPWTFFPECIPVRSPGGEITAATLRIDVQPFVATEPTTWGRIKSLYR